MPTYGLYGLPGLKSLTPLFLFCCVLFSLVTALSQADGRATNSLTREEAHQHIENLLAKVHESNDPAEIKVWVAEAKQLVERFPHQAFLYDIQIIECWLSVDKEVMLARTTIESILNTIDAEAYPKAYAEMRHCWGYSSEITGNLNEAAKAYAFAVAEGRRLNDKELLADALGSQGDLLSYRGDHAEALHNLKESYDLYEALNDEHSTRFTLNSIANVYSRLGEYEQALVYYQQLLRHDEAAKLPEAIAITRYNIGRAEESQGSLKMARMQFEKALEIAQQIDSPFTTAITRRSLASIMVKEGQAREALPMLNETIAFYSTQNDPQMVALTRLTRGSAFRQLGQYQAALADLNSALDEFVASQHIRGIAEVELERATTYAAQEKYELAYQALREHLEAHATSDTNMREEQTTRMRVLFDSEQKDKENAALMREKELQAQQLSDSKRIRLLQSITLILALILVVILSALVVRHIRQTRKLSALAHTDELTGLSNRRSILNFGEHQIAQAKRYRTPFTVLVLDVDFFKKINDTYGHQGGDVVLQKLAQSCKESLREGDQLGRTGGEEFMAVLPMTEYTAALDVAERLRQAISRLAFTEINPKLQVTASIGVAQWRDTDDNMSLITQRADDALYRAKGGGRNKVELAD